MNEETLFAEAIAIESPEERSQLLDAACGDNLELRRSVEKLLQLAADAGSFLEHSPLKAAADALKGTEPPMGCGNGSTHENEAEATIPRQTMDQQPQEQDDEIPLSYLQPSTQPDSLGRLGHYEILEVVGRGAFGTVLRAFDERLQRMVAVKVLAPEMAASSSARKRFLREARTSAQIRHENVVSIHAVEDDSIPYLVMEFIPGKTLRQRLDEQGPLDLPDVLRLGKQIADGLAAAHAQGLIHRDIKPGNILLEGGMHERVKITDFGLARTADDDRLTHSGVLAGTPLYMAPEQAQGQTLDQRADLFSFGTVLYHMLTGLPPFRAPNTLAVLNRVVEDTPQPIPEIMPDVPDWMCRLVAHLHAKNSHERYSSAKEVSELLGKCAVDLQASRAPTIPDPSKTAEESPEDDSEIRPRRVESLLQSPLGKVAAAVVIMLCVLGITEAAGTTTFTSTVIRLAIGSGTLVIETDDPGVMITIDGEEVTIRGGGVEEFTLRPGKHQVAAIRGDQPAKQELVTITRNGRTSVRMSLESGEAIARSSDARSVRPDHREGSADASPNAPTLKKTLVGHTSSIYTVVYSPNGRWLASTGDGEVFVWDMQSGELAYALPVQKDARFTAITFSPDGQFLLTAPLSAPAPVSIWEATTGKPAGVLEGHAEGLYDLSFSPDGQTLVSGGHESFVRMWDFPGRRKLRDIPSDSRWVRSAIFSPKGQFAFGQDRVFLAEADGKIFKTINKHAGPLCFSPDGRRLAGTTWQQGLVTVWNVDTGKEIASWRAHGETAEGLAFSRDGNVLATAGGDARVRLWDWQSQRQLAELSHDLRVNWVAFSPDRVTLATAAKDRLVKLWDVSAIVAQ